MDRVSFVKMTGAGNDFVVMDNRSGVYRFSVTQIARLCDRHFGIGADGLLLVEKPEVDRTDFRMRYYNADGGEAEMCGNGARCFARFVESFPRAHPQFVRFSTLAGEIKAEFLGDRVRINLPVASELKLGCRADFGWGEIEYHFADTGVPHVIVFVSDIAPIDVVFWGKAIRSHPSFPRGTNVNFVEVRDNRLVIRTYERGVEGETLACGTGVTAAALVANRVLGRELPIEIQVRSGDCLQVVAVWDGSGFQDVWLTGPATQVFQGEIPL